MYKIIKNLGSSFWRYDCANSKSGYNLNMTEKYYIYETRSGQKVAELEWTPGGGPALVCEDTRVRAELERLVGRDLLTTDDPDSFGDPVDEGAMCYLGQRSVTPTDPAYLAVLRRQLPLFSRYEIRNLPDAAL